VSQALVIGRVLSISGDGTYTVGYTVGSEHFTTRALSTVAVASHDAGRAVTIGFAEGDPDRPVILGLLQPDSKTRERVQESDAPPWKVEVEGKRIVLSAAHEIVLRCGKSSVTLTSAGKVIIRGAYVLSRASGVNRIKGASVQIN
jgi:hypothetical protein